MFFLSLSLVLYRVQSSPPISFSSLSCERKQPIYFLSEGGVLYERFFGFSFSLSVAHILFGFGFFGVDSEGGFVEVLVG